MQPNVCALGAFRWFQAGSDELLRPSQHEAGPVQHAAAALRAAAALPPRSHTSAAVAPDETPAARAAAAAPQAPSTGTVSPAGLSKAPGLMSSTALTFC